MRWRVTLLVNDVFGEVDTMQNERRERLQR
jgi:hypothetical protein